MKRPARAGAFVRGLSPWRLPWMLGLMLACASPGVHGGLTNNWLQAYARAMDANAPCLEGICCVPGAEGTAGGSGQPGVARGIMACRPCLEQERLEQQWEAQEAARAAAREGYRRLGEQDGPGRLQIGISSDGSVHVSQRVARGMPIWRVTEPEVNLWLEDRPLEYVPGRGPAVSVVLRYKNHAGVLGEYASTNGTDYGLLDTNVFSLGWRWGCEWRGWVEPGPGSTNATLHSGEGRVLVHGLGQVEYHTQRVLTLDASTNYYVLLYPSGAKDYYGLRSLSGTNYGALVLGTNRAGGTVLRYFLAERADPQGESLKFRYSISSNGPVRLEAVLDAEGRSTLLSYVEGANTTFAALVWKIRDPETNTVEFQYASSGALTNIIDPAGIATGLAYDEAQSVRSLVTAYGTTEFEYPALGNWRGLRVSEPDGAQHLWVASVSVSTELVTGIYDGSEVPCTEREGWFAFTNTFHLSELNTYDSFYWGSRQYALLSTNAVGSFGEGEGVGLFTNLTSGDYLASRMRHWLSAGTNRNEFSLTLALERAPSADGMTEGLKTWFDHEGKPEAYPGQEGTQRWPRCVATRAPGAAEEESVFTWFVRNALGHPTQVIETYNDANGDWATRTNWFAYTSEGIDLLSHTNALGVAVFRNAYDPSAAHRLLASTNALGEVTEYAYNSLGQVTNVSRPSGWNTAYLYATDGAYAGWLERVIDYETVADSPQPLRTNAFTYLGGRVYTHQDARERVVTNFWDALGRPTGQAFADGSSTTNLYHLSGASPYSGSTGGTHLLDVTRTRDRNGNWTEYEYDPARRMIAATDALTNTIQVQYCDCGVVEQVTTAMTNVTRYEYDNAGRRVRSFLPSGLVVTNEYDALGRLVQVADAHGYRLASLNNQGLVTALSNAVDRVAAFEYDVLDRVTSQTDAHGLETTFSHDALGRLTARLVTGTASEEFRHSARGLTNYVDALTNATWYVYDALGRLVNQTNANAEVLGFGYSPAGDLLSLSDGRGNTTRWTYDAEGRVTVKTDALGTNILSYAYDPGGRLTNRWSLGKGNSRYTFDAVGNLTQVTYEANTNGLATNVVTFAYDKDGRLTGMVDSAGTNVYTYANGLLASEDGPWAGDTVSISNDNGRRQALSIQQPTASAWVEAYGFDEASRLTSVSSPAGSFEYTYLEGSGLVRELSLPNGMSITNQHDSVGRLLGTWLTTAAGVTVNGHEYQYNTGSQRTRQTRSAGDYVDYGYDPIGQLESAVGREAGGATSRLHEQLGYGYDASGNLQYRTNNGFLQTFSVDALNQLTSVGRANTLTVAGGTSGSATNVTVNGYTAALYGDGSFAKEGFTLSAGPDTFTAVARDSLGRVETNVVSVSLPASVAYLYDGNGNLVSDGRRGFEWDAENQLVRVTVTNSWRSQFLYDGFGRLRVRTECVWQNSTWATNAVVRYVYDGMLVVQERDGNNLPRVTYTRGRDLSGSREEAGGIGGLLARTENALLLSPGGRSPHAYYQADGNGNITCLVDGAGAVAARYLYDPYGNLIAKAGRLADANLYRFSSKELHVASGLYYYGYRFYEPSLQRWMSRDPLREHGDINLHRFAGNDPVARADYFGLEGGFTYEPDGKMQSPFCKWERILSGPISGLLNFLENSDEPATIGPPLSGLLSELQQDKPWPEVDSFNNLTWADYGSWRNPFATLWVALSLGQFRYINDGSYTRILDTYAFPFSSPDWSGGMNHHNGLLAPLGFLGLPYTVSGVWPTPSHAE